MKIFTSGQWRTLTAKSFAWGVSLTLLYTSFALAEADDDSLDLVSIKIEYVAGVCKDMAKPRPQAQGTRVQVTTLNKLELQRKEKPKNRANELIREMQNMVEDLEDGLQAEPSASEAIRFLIFAQEQVKNEQFFECEKGASALLPKS